MTKKYGFFSAEMAKLHGSVFWSTPDGNEVEITAVYNTPTGDDCKWADKQYVGEVVRFARDGKQGTKKFGIPIF